MWTIQVGCYITQPSSVHCDCHIHGLVLGCTILSSPSVKSHLETLTLLIASRYALNFLFYFRILTLFSRSKISMLWIQTVLASVDQYSIFNTHRELVHVARLPSEHHSVSSCSRPHLHGPSLNLSDPIQQQQYASIIITTVIVGIRLLAHRHLHPTWHKTIQRNGLARTLLIQFRLNNKPPETTMWTWFEALWHCRLTVGLVNSLPPSTSKSTFLTELASKGYIDTMPSSVSPERHSALEKFVPFGGFHCVFHLGVYLIHWVSDIEWARGAVTFASFLAYYVIFLINLLVRSGLLAQRSRRVEGLLFVWPLNQELQAT